MTDKRKKGRKDQPTAEERLHARIRHEYKNLKRSDTLQHLWMRRSGKTVHMTLAEKYGMPCQAILDIVDPTREQQTGRITRHYQRAGYRAWRESPLEFDYNGWFRNNRKQTA